MVSGCRRASVTYCFTGKLPDLLGVKARSSLVYTQPWISARNMSTSSQPISHRGGAVWAADTSRFPWTMRPIPHARLLSVTGNVETDTDRGTLLLHWATEPSPPLGPSSWGQPESGSLFKRQGALRPNSSEIIVAMYCFGSTSKIIVCFYSCFISLQLECIDIFFQSIFHHECVSYSFEQWNGKKKKHLLSLSWKALFWNDKGRSPSKGNL